MITITAIITVTPGSDALMAAELLKVAAHVRANEPDTIDFFISHKILVAGEGLWDIEFACELLCSARSSRGNGNKPLRSVLLRSRYKRLCDSARPNDSPAEAWDGLGVDNDWLR